MSHPQNAAKRRKWQDEFDVARLVLKDEPGSLEWASDDYVVFRYIEPGLRIVFYPHRTSAGNYHIRIRKELGNDKKRFELLARNLFIGAGLSCTFSQNSTPLRLAKPGEEYGWAAKEAIGRSWI